MKNFKKHLEVLSKNELTEREILNLKRALNPSSYCTKNQSNALVLTVNSATYNLDKALTEKGITYLKSKCFKVDGSIRKNKGSLIEEMNEFHFEILRNFKKFLLVGFENVSSNSYENYVPVYRVIAKNNDFFDYTGISFEESEIIFSGKLIK